MEPALPAPAPAAPPDAAESPPPAKPDLAVTKVQVPNSVNRNANFSAQVTVQNRGAIAVSVANVAMRAAISDGLSAQDVPAGSGGIPQIGPGATKKGNIDGRAPNRAGVYTLTVTVDSLAGDLRPEDNRYIASLIVN